MGDEHPDAAHDPEVRKILRLGRLKYVDLQSPGIRRRRRAGGFAFIRADGQALRDLAAISRIKKLAIPPAWQDVWISDDPRGHIQAVGRDARKRKQYKYHDDWRRFQDQRKYAGVIAFAKALPKIRRTAHRHLKLNKLPRKKVLAAVVLVMEKTLIRVGNEEYARKNHSYGLTTLQNRHAKVNGSHVAFHFTGKSGIKHDIDLDDAKLAGIVRKCRELPGHELFEYVDEKGVVHDIGSGDVNNYLREISGEHFTAKEYRTWAGTVLAAKALKEFEEASSGRVLKRNLLKAIETVAERLGNTRAVCRKCYIHPAVMNAYLDGDLRERLKQRASAELKRPARHGLVEDEISVLRMLERTL